MPLVRLLPSRRSGFAVVALLAVAWGIASLASADGDKRDPKGGPVPLKGAPIRDLATSLRIPLSEDSNPNHFKCYKVRGNGRYQERTVTVADQFETKVTRVLKPLLLCNPVDKNGEGIPCEGNHLVCYRIKDAAGQMPFQRRTVDVLDQFGLPEVKVLRGDCRSTAYFCVPSTKRIASPSGAFVDIARGLLD